MKANTLSFSLGLAILAACCGCQTSAPTRRAPAVALGNGPILFLPVLPGREGLAQAAADTSRELRQEARGKLGTRAIFAEDLTELRNALSTQNLQTDGSINLSEIATLGEVANCGSVFVLELTGNDPYMPQSMTGTAVLVDTKTTRVLAERIISLRLADPRVLNSYQLYLEKTRSFRVGNLESKSDDREHTALLSPSLFRGFVAYAVVEDLFGGAGAAPSIHLDQGHKRGTGLADLMEKLAD